MIEFGNIKKTYNKWSEHKNNEFNKLKTNENKLNNTYSKIYNIKTEPINEKNISLNIANLKKDIESFISYFVGGLLIFVGLYKTVNYYIQDKKLKEEQILTDTKIVSAIKKLLCLAFNF